ncbi:MAG: hypothetical protein N2510_01815 [Ignavibacteria bacterium]|nr:hypothetical protein [Ignavibacteria bacterium]
MHTKTGNSVIHLDRYSKAVLTLIAFFLALITVNLYFSPEDANAISSVQDVNIKTINGYSISGGYIPVDIQRVDGSSNKNLQVDIKTINGRSIYGDKLPVDIQSVNGQFIVGGNLPVTVK